MGYVIDDHPSIPGAEVWVDEYGVRTIQLGAHWIEARPRAGTIDPYLYNVTEPELDDLVAAMRDQFAWLASEGRRR